MDGFDGLSDFAGSVEDTCSFDEVGKLLRLCARKSIPCSQITSHFMDISNWTA